MRSLTLLGDRYRLGPVIGTGGMGAVHRAYDERFGREVAVKVVRSGADDVERERMRREAQYLAGLDHANLVAVYDAGWDNTLPGETVWFAMELVEGPDLRRVLRDGGPMPTADVAKVLEGAAGALAVLHEAGVVHRDLKPANVLLTAEPASGRWDVKLADLGIAQLMRGDQLTSTGQVIGTAAYLSPEQVSGERVGPASDLYALGLLVIEALTGEIAFPGRPVESAAARLVRSPEVPHGVDPAWRALLTAMTARDPAARPSAAAVVQRCAALPRSATPMASAGATLVLPAAAAPIDDDATQAMAVLDTRPLDRPAAAIPTTGWTPSLRRRPAPRRRRRTLLAAGALTAVAAVAGGGAAIVGGTTGPEVAAAPAHAAAASDPAAATRSTRSPSPSATPSASASRTVHVVQPKPKPTQTQTQTQTRKHEDSHQRAPVGAQPVPPGAAAEHAIAHRATRGLERLRERLEHRLRDRLSGG